MGSSTGWVEDLKEQATLKVRSPARQKHERVRSEGRKMRRLSEEGM